MLARSDSVLLLIDMQQSYVGKLHDEERLVEGVGRMAEASGILEVPLIVTEQYPKGLGGTRAEIMQRLPEKYDRFEKTSFSCLGAEGLPERLRNLGRRQVVVVGIETHVCVGQTVHDLLAAGYEPHIIRDAIGSRFPLEDGVSWQKMTGSGAVPSSVEGALFEWLDGARDPHFKAVQKLVV